MHLLYLTFGKNIANHIQAHFSILTFLAEKNSISTINIITDEPSYYTNINDSVNVIAVPAETLQQWRGPHDFFWRIKIKAIEHVCNLYANEPVMYLDTDTFLYNSLATIAGAAKGGKAFMHENEGRLADDKSKTGRKMFAQINNISYGEVTITPSDCMWNAGVVLTPNTKNNQECLLALHICDEMCRQGVTRRLIEQFALSVALQHSYGLQEAVGTVAHYWSNKEPWIKAIEEFLLTARFKQLSVTETIHALQHFNYHIPVKQRVRNTNIRLKQLADTWYPPANATFVQYQLKAQ